MIASVSQRQQQHHPHAVRTQRKQTTDVVKLVVLGMSGSGKTSFIQAVSQYTEWQNDPGASWFFGRVRVDQSLILHFLEPPMAQEFDFLWLREILSRIHATGFVIMLDSTKPQFFGEFLSVLYTIRGFHDNAPIVVAANKQDHPRAWAAQDIALGLGIRDVPVLPCIANSHEAVRDVVINLLYQVME